MTINKEAVRVFEDSRGLDSCLIAVKYTNEPDPGASRDRKLAPCEAIELVRRERALISLSSETCNCAGGK